MDWLVGRTLTRSAIFMPKSAPVLMAYEGMTVLAQLAATAGALLAHAGLLWLSLWSLRRSQRRLAAALLSLFGLNLFGLFEPFGPGLALAYQAIALWALVELGRLATNGPGGRLRRLTWALPVGALAAGKLHQAVAAMSGAFPVPGWPELSLRLHSLGEALAVASALVFGLAIARREALWRTWLPAAIPALAFSLMYLAAPAMTAVLSIWSVTLTLYLPWPLYALGLWSSTAALLATLRRGQPAGPAIALLFAASFAPQLSTHLAYGLIALWLLSLGTGRQEPVQPEPNPLGRTADDLRVRLRRTAAAPYQP